MNPTTTPVQGMDMGSKKGAASTINVINLPRSPTNSRKLLNVIPSGGTFFET